MAMHIKTLSRQFQREVVIVNRKTINKLKKTFLMPFMSVSLLQANTVKGRDIFFSNLEISLENICSLYPQRIKKLFANLDLNCEGLEQVKTAVKKKDWPSACQALITYYQESNTVSWLRKPTVESNTSSKPNVELILQDTFTFQLATGKVPRRENGLLDWTNKGPKNDKEWTWFLNRHYHLADLLVAYQDTGNPAYVRCINNHIIDWIISNPSKTSLKIWGQWRGLEAAFRVVHWSRIFYSLQQVEEFTAEARILMLSSILDHAYYLRYLHTWGANWLIREMNGLATIALCWGEFKDAKKWLDYAIARMGYEINEQVYPDGVQKELTSHYHLTVLQNFQDFADSIELSGGSVSPAFKTRLEKMWNYLAYSIRPDSYGTLNNDSDRNYLRPLLIKAAAAYERPDWTYIATNGEAGCKPKGEPSVVFPWAGQAIARSSWDAETEWSFFDIGPLGISYHIHRDKLHLSVVAYGRDLLVDAGRYSYVRDRFWHYFRGSASHNVILIDGGGQKTDLRESIEPVTGKYAIEPEFDFAQGTFDGGFIGVKGKAIVSRAVVYLRGEYWVVVDRVVTDRPRKLEALWHFHPDCTVVIEEESVASTDPGVGNLRIIPCSNFSWTVNLVRGQENPPQGWWSREYNHKIPNPTAVYSTHIEKSTIFAWVMIPAKGIVPKLNVNILPAPEGTILFTVETCDRKQDKFVLRMSDRNPIEIGDGLQFDGNCAILRSDREPLVAFGCITDATGKVIKKSE